MNRTLQIKPLLAIVAVVVALVIGAAGGAALTAAGSSTGDDRVGALQGAWRMTSLEIAVDGDLQEVPYSGEILIDATGRVAVQARNPDDTAPDTEFTVEGYEAWAGPADVDQDAGTFVARVDSAVAPAMVGTDQARAFEVSDERLVLTPADRSGAFRASYERY